MHPEKSSSGRKLLFPLILVLSSAVESVSKDKISVLDDSLKLDLRGFRTRLGRQFKEAVAEDEDGVAIGLIDALQRWADALEDQVSVQNSASTVCSICKLICRHTVCLDSPGYFWGSVPLLLYHGQSQSGISYHSTPVFLKTCSTGACGLTSVPACTEVTALIPDWIWGGGDDRDYDRGSAWK